MKFTHARNICTWKARRKKLFSDALFDFAMCEKTENEMFAQIEPLITISFQEALNSRSPARSRKEHNRHRNFAADLFANALR